MKEELSQTEKQKDNTLKPWLWKKGQSGNIMGRPKGKTMKEYARQYLERMTSEEKDEWLEGLPKEIVWQMSEGRPKQDIEHSGQLAISNVLSELENDGGKENDIGQGGQETLGQGVEAEVPVQDQGQKTEPDNVQEEQSADTLRTE